MSLSEGDYSKPDAVVAKCLLLFYLQTHTTVKFPHMYVAMALHIQSATRLSRWARTLFAYCTEARRCHSVPSPPVRLTPARFTLTAVEGWRPWGRNPASLVGNGLYSYLMFKYICTVCAVSTECMCTDFSQYMCTHRLYVYQDSLFKYLNFISSGQVSQLNILEYICAECAYYLNLRNWALTKTGSYYHLSTTFTLCRLKSTYSLRSNYFSP